MCWQPSQYQRGPRRADRAETAIRLLRRQHVEQDARMLGRLDCIVSHDRRVAVRVGNFKGRAAELRRGRPPPVVGGQDKFGLVDREGRRFAGVGWSVAAAALQTKAARKLWGLPTSDRRTRGLRRDRGRWWNAGSSVNGECHHGSDALLSVRRAARWSACVACPGRRCRSSRRPTGSACRSNSRRAG